MFRPFIFVHSIKYIESNKYRQEFSYIFKIILFFCKKQKQNFVNCKHIYMYLNESNILIL